MFLDPSDLHPAQIEEIEKASARLVTQAVYEFRETAADIFSKEEDLAQDIAEDITREALDRLGVSRMDLRIYGKIDYKRARYVFHPEYAVRQALLVDSKAEKDHGTSTLQTAQTSMRIRHIRADQPVDEAGELPVNIGKCLTTTIFVKYEYQDEPENKLLEIIIAALPSGMLQDRYNPSHQDTIWRAGRNAPTRGEPFRVRLVFGLLKNKMRWRVQSIPMNPMLPATPGSFPWDE
ncbi:MAG TPA: SfiI family type II restriction endonuclease [Terriglobia bacterium]|nr:SfiI family type II restriction endonuclease [Terriglobia bacterium]